MVDAEKGIQIPWALVRRSPRIIRFAVVQPGHAEFADLLLVELTKIKRQFRGAPVHAQE